MKRSSYDDGEIERLAMANCMMLLSRMGNKIIDGDFKCKTCNQRFPTYQALGGHRTSHKRHKVVKPNTHHCSICGLEFGTGQALGGHMRRHRAGGAAVSSSVSTVTSHSSANAEPGLEKSCSSKRVLCFDLNLVPCENDLKLE